MAAVAAIVAAGGGEGGMFVPGAPHLGGSARTRAGRGSVLTIYVYMPPQSHSLHVYQLWSIIKVINKTAYRKENLTILIFCEAYSKKEKKCFFTFPPVRCSWFWWNTCFSPASSVVEKQKRFAPIKPFLSLLDPFLSFDSDGRCDSCKQSCCHFASFVSLLQNNIWSFLW